MNKPLSDIPFPPKKKLIPSFLHFTEKQKSIKDSLDTYEVF